MKTLEVTKSTSLKDLVTLAKEEREVVLTQDNQPVAKVLPIPSPQEPSHGMPGPRILGLHRGEWTVGDDFDQSLPNEFWLGEK